MALVPQSRDFEKTHGHLRSLRGQMRSFVKHVKLSIFSFREINAVKERRKEKKAGVASKLN